MITVTGATGHTGSVVASTLLEKGVGVYALGRSAEHLIPLKMKGALPLTGDQGDEDFLTKALDGVDGLYLMIPPKFDAENIREYYNQMGDVAINAIRRSGVKKVVFLSSLGAERESGTGPVLGLHDVENKLHTLQDVDIAILRPGFFMENTLGTIDLIKEKGINGGAMQPDAPVSLTATKDIGEKAAELLEYLEFTGQTVHELIGDRLSFAKITAVIAHELKIQHLPYIQFSTEDSVAAFKSMGMSTSVAEAFVELMTGVGTGHITPTTTRFNAPTRYARFVEEVFKPAYLKATHHAIA